MRPRLVQSPLRLKIETRKAQLEDDLALDKLFANYLDTLPDDQRPKSSIERSRLHIEWHDNFTKELDGWKEEHVVLKSQPINKRAIFDSATERLLRLLGREAAAAELLPQDNVVRNSVSRSHQTEATKLGLGEDRAQISSIKSAGSRKFLTGSSPPEAPTPNPQPSISRSG